MRIRLKKPALLGAKRMRFDCVVEKIQTRAAPGKDEKRLVLFLKGPEGRGVILLKKEEVDLILMEAERSRIETPVIGPVSGEEKMLPRIKPKRKKK